MLNVKCQFQWRESIVPDKKHFRVRTSQYSFEFEKSHFPSADGRNFPQLNVSIRRNVIALAHTPNLIYSKVLYMTVAIKYEDIKSCQNVRCELNGELRATA